MSEEVRIRAYEPRDRSSVRHLCCETALRGEPVDSLFSDREVVADLLTRYYTTYEPEACWVAECKERVAGYLTGCLDQRRYQRLQFTCIVPRASLRAILGGALCRRETWRLLRAALRLWQLGGAESPRLPEDYSAHLHVNLERRWRGQRIGERLVERFLQQAAAARVHGVCASVRNDNPAACRLFDRLGFVPVARVPSVLPVEEGLAQHETIVYGKRL